MQQSLVKVNFCNSRVREGPAGLQLPKPRPEPLIPPARGWSAPRGPGRTRSREGPARDGPGAAPSAATAPRTPRPAARTVWLDGRRPHPVAGRVGPTAARLTCVSAAILPALTPEPLPERFRVTARAHAAGRGQEPAGAGPGAPGRDGGRCSLGGEAGSGMEFLGRRREQSRPPPQGLLLSPPGPFSAWPRGRRRSLRICNSVRPPRSLRLASSSQVRPGLPHVACAE